MPRQPPPWRSAEAFSPWSIRPTFSVSLILDQITATTQQLGKFLLAGIQKSAPNASNVQLVFNFKDQRHLLENLQAHDAQRLQNLEIYGHIMPIRRDFREFLDSLCPKYQPSLSRVFILTVSNSRRDNFRDSHQFGSQLLGCIQQQRPYRQASILRSQSTQAPLIITIMTTVFSKPVPKSTAASSSPNFQHENRFSALLNDAIHQQNNEVTKETYQQPSLTKATDTEEPWIVPLNKRERRTQKKKIAQEGQNTISTVYSLLPKTLPKKIPDPEFPDPEYIINGFSIDCRIKVKPHESVNPSRLVKAVLMIFQQIDNQTAITTSMYNAKGCPMICDPEKIPTTESGLTPFVSSWKKIRADMFMCRFHMVSASPYEHIKKDPDVFEYLREEKIFLEQALLASSDHHLVGFIVNIIPEETSIRAQQNRFELLLQDKPGFQLVIRKLNFKENSRLFCDVLKVRVDRADADEITIAFNALSASSTDFKYYAFDEYSGLHDNQKRYIIETQRSFVSQNQSVVVEWPINKIPFAFTMWMEPDTTEEEHANEHEDNSFPLTQPEDIMDHTVEQNAGSKRGRPEEETTETDATKENTKKPKQPQTQSQHYYNNVDLTKTGIEDFMYSFTSSDGVPLIRFAYPPAEGVREFLVNRYKRAEVNLLLKVLVREIARHMSDLSRSIAFPNADEIYHETTVTSTWQPSNLCRLVPHSTTQVHTVDRPQGNKRRATTKSLVTGERSYSSPSNSNLKTTATVSTPASSHVQTLPSTAVANSGTATICNQNVTNAEVSNRFQEQLHALQQQHNRLFENVQQMNRHYQDELQEVQNLIKSNQGKVEYQVEQMLDKHGSNLVERITNQCTVSLNNLRQETIAMDQKNAANIAKVKTDLSANIESAIDKLTTVVANMTMQQNQFIQQCTTDKENDKNILHEQLTLFMNNFRSSGMVDPKSYSTASTTLPLNITEPSTSTASTSQSAENTTVPTTLSTLPSSNRATLTPLHNNIKKAGRGGGRIGPRELRQQTINQILPTRSGEPPNVTDSPHSTS